MTTIPLHPPTSSASSQNTQSPLPPLLRTPYLGLTLLEVQGSLNFPPSTDSTHDGDANLLEVGRIEFPLLGSRAPADAVETEADWMKKVYLYVGKSQRLVGEVKKLQKPLAVVGRSRENATPDDSDLIEVATNERMEAHGEELEIMDVVQWKIFFGGRPEFV
ncbi:MAG: hypothetical protein M1831_003112 [Alyxoria varia]|nr:MAG: hypothetical protein M1831_003112 [Alyxoria varia]